MCRYLYLASDKELPLIKWEESRPAFNVDELHDYDLDVLKQFSKPHVVFLGAHTGCSCGFGFDSETPADMDEAREDRDARESVRLLVQYLREQAEESSLEMFSCWNGDQGETPTETLSVQTEYFANLTEFPISDEPTFFLVRNL